MNKHNHNSNGGDFAEEVETLPRHEHVGSFAEGAKRRCRTNMSARLSRDLAPDLMVIAGFDGYFKRVNPATERILGYSRRELLSRTFQEFVHHDDVERTLDQFAKLMMGGYEAIEFENRYRCADGSVRWIEWNARTVPERRFVYGVGRDVTDRRRADAQLREAQRIAEASRAELRMLAAEQAALRRVATLVAKAVPSSELFDAVVREVGTLLGADFSGLVCFGDDAVVPVATWAAVGDLPPVPSSWPIHPGDPVTMIAKTSRPVRWEDMTAIEGPLAVFIRETGVRSAVTCPIVVEGRVWGALEVSSRRSGSLPPDTESRLAQFTDLVGTAFANAEARAEAARLAREQAALRRVATLVARERPPEEVFASVAEEAGRVLGVADTAMWRHEPDGSATVVAVWTKHGSAPLRLGAQMRPGGQNAASLVLRTGRPARIDDFSTATGPIGERMHAAGIGSAVGAPIVVAGRIWGAMIAATREPGPLPAGTESRIEKFTELVATAISNMQARADLAASRARIVAATDEERRRVVRDLHDGAQSRLVHTTLTLKLAQSAVQDGEEDASALVTEALDHAERATAELRELAHGILPAALTRGGLSAGVQALTSRMPLSVTIGVSAGRLPTAVEATAYFVICEALTNVAKHARAGHAEVTAGIEDGTLVVQVRDDGVGGARPEGSGLVGLADRLAALDGLLRIETPSGGGTLITAAIPLTGSDARAAPPTRAPLSD
jgi:PAS domain S-box-containing protein